MKLPILLFSLFMFAGITAGSPDDPTSLSDKIVIRGDKKFNTENRTFAFTNKAYGQYYSEAADYFTDGWMGWTLREQRIFNDYAVIPSGGEPLNRKEADIYIYPYKVVRQYPGNIKEQFVFADNKDQIVLQVQNVNSFRLVLKGITATQISKFAASGFKVSSPVIRSGYHLFVMSNSLIATGVQSADSLIFSIDSKTQTTDIILCIVPSEREAMTEFKTLQYTERVKKERIDKLLKLNAITTNDTDFDNAFLWAVANADALVAQQDMKGIFAGLPWFNNFWGRDTFISLAGCTYTQSNYEDARKIILAFLNALDTNPQSPYYGRVPNRITLTESIYNTVDGTPRLIAEAEKYFRLTGDTALVKMIYPKVVTALKAAVEKRIDKEGFLTHADAETWMDAVGPDGPWSPRGNRANDIQALWLKQLFSTAYFAGIMKDNATKEQAKSLADKLIVSFRERFLNPDGFTIYDRLTLAGERDSSHRPNFYIPLLEKKFFASERERLQYAITGIAATTTAKGVYSLAPHNKNFHPFHQYPPYYPKDAAYHNGIIWQWNTGPAVSFLTSVGRSDLAWEMTKTLTDEILERGMAGGMAELCDAFPRKEDELPHLSGTYLQAWSVAEYVRNVYEDYAGAQYSAPENTITLSPSLPRELNSFAFTRVYNKKEIGITYSVSKDLFSVRLTPRFEKGLFNVNCIITGPDGSKYSVNTQLREDDPYDIVIPFGTKGSAYTVHGENRKPLTVTIAAPDNDILLPAAKIRFNTDTFSADIQALKGPSYPVLKNSDVIKSSSTAKLLTSVSAQPQLLGYEYPKNPAFKPGIAELNNFTITEDAENYYFSLKYSALTNPGWHNEYGFQLTYTSVCINTGTGTASREVRRNSKYLLPEERAYTLQINIGGGYEIRNAQGEIIAAYLPVPEDVKNPLGNVTDATVHFAVPKKYTGVIPKDAVITILTGLQDDHGGAGIGEFREVQMKTEEWSGGGKKNPEAPNVYSILTIN